MKSSALIMFVGLVIPIQSSTAQTRPAESRPRNAVATVSSKDGTAIAYEQSGDGPPVIIVASALADRTGARRLASLLSKEFTVINYDRRGRGASGDAKTYAVDREIEDIEALIDKAGRPALLFGSSSGAALALEAANKLPTKVKMVAMFEPPFIVDDSRAPVPEDFVAHVTKLAAEGRRGDAVEYFMTKAAGVPAEFVAQMRASPMWAGMEKLADTIAYDATIVSGLQSGKPLPTTRWTSVTARCLVMDGERSDAFLRNAARALAGVLKGATRQTIPGQDHSAVFTAPQALVPPLVAFFKAEAAK